MESLFNRYRNITVLLVAICAQLVLVAWQMKGENDVPLLRVWAVSAITPAASFIENLRNGTTGFFGSYFALKDARDQARRLKSETDKLTLENQLLKNALAEAQRTEALLGFQSRTPSRMVGARVIGTTSGAGAKSILIDKGSQSGIRKGMAVVTPAGIIGRVLAVYPFASQVLTVSDAGFAAGVESQKNHARGIMRGLGNGQVRVDYVPGAQKVEIGELFFTSGEDRVFPKGLPAAKLISSKESPTYLEIFAQPLGDESAPEEVLVIVDPVHQEIPDAPIAEAPVFLAPDVAPAEVPVADPNGGAVNPAGGRSSQGTQADKMFDQYKKIGDAQSFKYGEGGPGSTPPNFNILPNLKTGVPQATAQTAAVTGASGTTGSLGPRGAAGMTGSAGNTGSSGTLKVAPRPAAPALPNSPTTAKP